MRGGAAHDGELVRVLDEAHLVEQRAHVADRAGARHAGAHLRAHRVQPALTRASQSASAPSG
jgi:hypothetical protein